MIDGAHGRMIDRPHGCSGILSPQHAINWNREVQHWLVRHIGIAPTGVEPRVEGEERP